MRIGGLKVKTRRRDAAIDTAAATTSNGNSIGTIPLQKDDNAKGQRRRKISVHLLLVLVSVSVLVMFGMVMFPKNYGYSHYHAGGQAGADDDDDDDDKHVKSNMQQASFRVLRASFVRQSSQDRSMLMSSSDQFPVLFTDWNDYLPEDWKLPQLMERIGRYPQYVKDTTVQPVKRQNNNNNKEPCVLPTQELVRHLSTQQNNLLMFTNDLENPELFQSLEKSYNPYPSTTIGDTDGFKVFSAMSQDQSHPFHKHGASWLGQVAGRRMWWFLPLSSSSSTTTKPKKVNACRYLTGQEALPEGAVSVLQNPGTIIQFPTDMYHATCALDAWTVGIGAQKGPPIRQNFPKLNPNQRFTDADVRRTRQECLGIFDDGSDATPAWSSSTQNSRMSDGGGGNGNEKDWLWYDGDLNAYYNSLETQDTKRDPNNLQSFAVHRWMGPTRSTEEHYRLLSQTFDRYVIAASAPSTRKNTRVLDAGCGLGSALVWMEQRYPSWSFTGYTISDEQYKFITNKLPPHKFSARLQSYDDLQHETEAFDVIYSIEALIHSMNIQNTIQEWSRHLTDGGIIVLIDDFVSVGTDKSGDDMQAFAKSWLANSLVTPSELGKIASEFGLSVIENRDLDAEYRIIERNYRNVIPQIKPFGGRTHQGWMGSKWRQRLMVEGKLTYNLIVFQKGTKNGNDKATAATTTTTCKAVPTIGTNSEEFAVDYPKITPQLMSGTGNNGGKPITCISGWYCCDKGVEYMERLKNGRTDDTNYLKLDESLFGHYMDAFSKHLNDHYETYPASAFAAGEQNTKGRFLDIGGTGSTSSGMKQVTSKFQHFAGPLEYWKLDVDAAARSLERTIVCDIDDCGEEEAASCSFDVTFSHTVLEHAYRPWKSFDTIARITKRGGLTLHLVPFSYQYHATPEDNFRFSHVALKTLLEDRGFDVLDVGYDICTKPDKMLRRVDEHYDTIWLTYVVGRKR